MITVKRQRGHYFATYQDGKVIANTPDGCNYKCACQCVAELLGSVYEWLILDLAINTEEFLERREVQCSGTANC